MSKKKKSVIIPVLLAVLAVVILSAVYVVLSVDKDKKTGIVYNDLDSFAKCLTDKEVKMYGTEWCGFCNRQKNLFGDSFQYIDFIDCDDNADLCQNAGVNGYPTWVIDNENYPGLTPLEQLASLSGCEL